MRKQLTIIGFTLFTIFIGFGIVIPLLPVMVQETGAPEYHFNIMLAAYSAVSFVVSPFWGALSDRIGRKPVLIAGVLGFSASFLLFGLSSGNLGLMYFSRILGGLFSGATTACAVAYVADITNEDNRTKGMGVVGMSIGLGFIFGPAIGGILSRFGHSVPFFTASVISLITAVFIVRVLKESLAVDQRTPSGKSGSRWAAFTGSVKYLYILLFLVTFTLAGLEGTLQFFQMQAFGATPEDVGYMFLASGIVGALIQGGFVRRYIKKGDEPKYIRIGFLLQGLGFILLIFSDSLVTAMIYLSVFGAGNALLRPCLTSLITQKTTVGQGAASGLSSSMDSLGRVGGPLLAALLYGMSVELPFYVSAVVCVAALFLVSLYVIRSKDLKSYSNR
ncbi:MFS transporter [Paenibacillus swuensis]|uniref:MFS transporter n=1 Tax=Paenibacillus swuensis TaxID=1178515 RepID=A0A172TK55_9BACL|nr:MFS transporter [Paenibacillus swuensis]ANE47418.1 MFS transporter [Paenibacillus swuensis]